MAMQEEDLEFDNYIDQQEEFGDKFVESNFAHQTTKLYTGKKSGHWVQLVSAFFQVVLHFMDVIANFLFALELMDKGYEGWGYFVIFIYLMKGVTEVIFDYLAAGPGLCLEVFLDIFLCGIVFDFATYIGEWKKFYNKRWAKSHFNANGCWNTLCHTAIIMSVHMYFLFTFDPNSDDALADESTQYQAAAFVFLCIRAFIDVGHFFKYISIDWEVYTFQMIKAFLGTLGRIAMWGLLLTTEAYVAILALIFFYCSGLFMYWLADHYSRINHKDDALEGHVFLKFLFAHQVAITTLFYSVPFAPNHSAHDWWIGYMASDTLANLQNACLMAYFANHWDTRDSTYYAGVGFAGFFILANVAILFILDKHVHRIAHERDIYSSSMIVNHWAHFGGHWKKEEKKKTQQPQPVGNADGDMEMQFRN